MICIPLAATTNDGLHALILRSAEVPVDCLELRLDHLEEEPAVERLVAAASRPVIATCRSLAEGGRHAGSADERRAVLRRAAGAGASWLDCEAGDVPPLSGLTGTTLIASLHDFEGIPVDLEEQVHALEATDAAWVKFAVTARKPCDNLRVLKLIAACRKPVIGIAMGEAGLASRILGRLYGCRLTFASLDSGLESAPGQLGAAEMLDLFRYRDLDRDTALHGVLTPLGAGRDVTAAINRMFRDSRQNAVAIPFSMEDARDFLATVPAALGLRSMIVRPPYQEAALAWADAAAERAHRAGRADVLVREGNMWTADLQDTVG